MRKHILTVQKLFFKKKKETRWFSAQEAWKRVLCRFVSDEWHNSKEIKPKMSPNCCSSFELISFFSSQRAFFSTINHCRPDLTGPKALISSRMWKWRHCNIIKVITLISGRLGCSWEREPSIMNEENINYISCGTPRVPETLPVPLLLCSDLWFKN